MNIDTNNIFVAIDNNDFELALKLNNIHLDKYNIATKKYQEEQDLFERAQNAYKTDLDIYKKDMLQAIELVDNLSKDIKEFINYRQKTDDHYDKLWQFFLDNTGIGFMRTNLIYQQYHHFGLSRDKFKDRFDDYIEAIKEMATDKGYFLDVKTVNHNSGKMYTLLKIEESPLAEDTISLEEML